LFNEKSLCKKHYTKESHQLEFPRLSAKIAQTEKCEQVKNSSHL